MTCKTNHTNNQTMSERALLAALNNRAYLLAETIGAALTVQKMLAADVLNQEDGKASQFSEFQRHALLVAVGDALAAALDYTVEVNDAAAKVGLQS